MADKDGSRDIRSYLIPRTADELLRATKSLRKKPPEFTYIQVYNARLGYTVWKKSYAEVYQ